MSICCLKPQIIINPALPQLLLQHGAVCIHDNIHVLSDVELSDCAYNFDWSYYYRMMPSDKEPETFEIDGDSYMNPYHMSNFYVLNITTGATFPIYLQVPCRKCEACRIKRVQELVSRCRYEVAGTGILPIYLTLTYNNKHLPKTGVSKEDVLKWKKRFRIQYARLAQKQGINTHPERDLKFFVSSEYGKYRNRPHYHALVFNVDLKMFGNCVDLCKSNFMKFCQYTWRVDKSRMPYEKFLSKKFIDFPKYGSVLGHVDCVFAYSSGVVRYIAKYMSKGTSVPQGLAEPFRPMVSQSFGVKFISSHRDDFCNSSTGTIKYIDYFDKSQKLVTCILSKYYIDKLFPSYNQIIPVSYRRNLFSESYLAQIYCSHFTKRKLYRQLVSDRAVPLYPVYDVNRKILNLKMDGEFLCDVMRPYRLSDDTFAYAFEMQRQRDVLLSKLSRYCSKFQCDPETFVHTWRRQNHFEEVL